MLKSMTLISLNLALLPLVHDCFITEIGSLVMLKELKETHTHMSYTYMYREILLHWRLTVSFLSYDLMIDDCFASNMTIISFS